MIESSFHTNYLTIAIEITLAASQLFQVNVTGQRNVLLNNSLESQSKLRRVDIIDSIMAVIGTQLDSDRRLLVFRTYEEYLESMVTPVDLCYLRSTSVACQLKELGNRCTEETLSEEAFYKRLTAVRNLLFPVRVPYVLSSEFTVPTDNLQQELALRERSNRLGVMSTIIFIRDYTKFGFEVSAYIDLIDRLGKEDWVPFFQGKKKLRPQPTDLGYYHWRMGKSLLNETFNYEPVFDPKRGLLFKNLHDRKFICVDPSASSPGVNTTRVRVHSEKYEHIILYDHVVRSKL